MYTNRDYMKLFIQFDFEYKRPILGSLVYLNQKPTNGFWKEVHIDGFCCPAPPPEPIPDVTIPVTGTFEVGGTIQVQISNADGQIFTGSSTNGVSAAASITALQAYLSANAPGLGTYTVSGTNIVLKPKYENLSGTAVFQAAPVAP